VVLPETCNGAFFHAAEILGIKVNTVPFDLKSFTTSANSYKRFINKNTICIIVSVPNCYGLLDPIESISELAGQYNVGLFVDASLGGFLTPFLNLDKQTDNYSETICDLRIKNMTSYAIDTHTYGLCARSNSLLYFSNEELHKLSNYAKSDSLDGVYYSYSLSQGNNASGVAAAWSVIVFNGYLGYEHSGRNIMQKTVLLAYDLSQITQLEVLGKDLCMGTVCFRSKDEKKVPLMDMWICLKNVYNWD